MLRSAISTRMSMQRIAAVGLATGTIGGAAFASTSEETLGLRRQGKFWLRVFPVVFDYYWKLSSSSPYVKYQNWSKPKGPLSDADKQKEKEERDLQTIQLHKKHAPEILQVMLDLKGLYIKLGQVLSVTSLPIPQEYRILFRTLQSDVPGWEDFQNVVKPVLEKEFGQPLEQIFEYVDPVPCGAASIGQAHRARLKPTDSSTSTGSSNTAMDVDVIIKVQYPDAAWQVPADIRCVGDLLRVCVWAGVVDEAASRLSFEEFSRQFTAELDYGAEQQNLKEIYRSSIRPGSPYPKRGVVVPKVCEHLCTEKVITMAFLPGPKLEQEARRQLELLGIDTSKGIQSVVQDVTRRRNQSASGEEREENPTLGAISQRSSWILSSASRLIRYTIGFDSLLWCIRGMRRWALWSTAVVVGMAAPWLPSEWGDWAEVHRTASEQAKRLAQTESWIDALFDVHGDQIFQLGLFNADAHPGNIILIQEEEGIVGNGNVGDKKKQPENRLGLIDFGQCKRLTREEQARVARLVVAVADGESDEMVADAFRGLGIQTKNDSTEFLSMFARLMFGRFEPHHLDPKWHQKIHKMDLVVYFPSELSMVYRTAMLLRGLAMSLQINAAVSDHWREHAQRALDRGQALEGKPRQERKHDDDDDDEEKKNKNQTRTVVVAGNSGLGGRGQGEKTPPLVVS